MICKKCGANMAETSKFCGNCGNKVEEISNSTINENSSVITQQNLDQSLLSDVTEPIQTEQLNTVNQIEQTVIVPPVSPLQPSVNESKKKSYAWIFIVGGILLGIIAIVLLIIAFNKSSNTPVKELEKALNIISEKGENSGTVDAKILIESDTSDTYNLSATVKYAKQYDDNYDISLTLNKSVLYDEMNFYATVTDDNLTLFANSSLIDMLGLTSSPTDMWIYFLINEDELGFEENIEEDGIYSLSDILDKEHYKIIDNENGLKHYQLIIDNELLDKIKAQASNEKELSEFEESLSEINGGSTELTDVYYVDIYINDLGELVKVSMDLSDQIEDESIKKVVLSFEFVNFGNTVVSIPNEAKNSMIDLETYFSTYMIVEDSTENMGSDYDTDYYYGM